MSIFAAAAGAAGGGGYSAQSGARGDAGIGNQSFSFGGINTNGAGGMPTWVWIAAGLAALYLFTRR